jgi:hypothetical protein
MTDGACNSAASPIVFFRNSDQQIEMDHGPLNGRMTVSRGNSAGRTTNAFLIICPGGNEKFLRAIEGRHSPHGSMGAGLPCVLFCRYCHGDDGRQPSPARRLVGCASYFFPQGGYEPDFLPCRHGSTFVVASGRYRRCPFAARTARSPGGAASPSIATSQIVYGLLYAPDGCPVAIEALDGKTADPMTLTG